MLELFEPAFWSALLAIVVIDLVLAGDNAIVIGLAARKLPENQQKKVIIWGTVGAVVIRILATLAVVWLLEVPGLLLVGGVLLIFIAYKLLVDESGHEIQTKDNFWAAIRTIIVADALMGLDNVLAVAGAAHGSFTLVVIGLVISVPIMVWGSTLILKWTERFPIIVKIGAGVLALTAAKMITGEEYLSGVFNGNPVLKWGFIILVISGVLLIGEYKRKCNEKKNEEKAA